MASSHKHVVLCQSLIGRAEPLAALEHLLDTTRQGHGQLALISGEAGIGKTRLVREFVDLARAQNWTILDGQCFPQDSLYPYAPFLDLLRTHFWQRSEELTAFSAELAPLLPDVLPQANASRAALEPEQEKRQRFAVLARLFIQQAAQQPLMLIIEDIHWSDDVSLELLLVLARQFASHPILVVLTYRNDEGDAPLLSWLAQIDRTRLGEEIVLARLSRHDVSEMLAAMFALEIPVRVDFLEALFALTEGNPFFIEEVLKALVGTGEIYYHNGMWDRRPLAEIRIPRSVQDAVQRRTIKMSVSARHVLALAAVVGRGFDFSLLLTLSELSEIELLAVLKELIAEQLVVEESSDHFVFRHALVREAIYADLLARERASLHRTIGETLERLAKQSVNQHLPELSYHFSQAEEWARALTYARRAGEQALQFDATRAAVEQFTRAIDAARHLNAAPDYELLQLRGQANEIIGEFERSRDDLLMALHLATDRHDERAEWQTLLALGLLWSSRDYEQAGQYLERALVLARSMGDKEALAHSLNRLGNWHMNTNIPRDAERYHHEAYQLFQGLNDQRGVAETLDLLGMASATGGDVQQAFAYFQQTIDAFRALDDRQGLVTPLAMQCVAWNSYLMNDGCMPGVLLDREAVTRRGDEAILLAQESGWRAGEAFTLYELSMTYAAHGEYQRGLELGQRALAISGEIQHRQWLAGSHVSLGRLYLDILALPQARQHLEEALNLARDLRSSNWLQIAGAMLAASLVQEGELEQAESLLTTTFDFSVPPASLSHRLGWCTRGELALVRGDPALALMCGEQLLATQTNQPANTDVSLRLRQLQGEAYAAQGQWDTAQWYLREALDAAQARGLPTLGWRMRRSLAHIYQQIHWHEEARAELAAARLIIDTLADDIPADSLRETFLREARALVPLPRNRTPRQTARQDFGGLTAREREVAIQLARGRSNRDIAADLVVSERTVEYHVGNILGKLNLSSRSQAAVWAVEHGLIEQAPDA